MYHKLKRDKNKILQRETPLHPWDIDQLKIVIYNSVQALLSENMKYGGL